MGKQSTSMMKCALAFAALALVYVFAGDCTTKQDQIPAIAIRQEMCPASAPFFGFMGCAAALVFACLGAAYGTAKSGVGVANMGVNHAQMVMKSIIPIIMAGLSAGIAIGIVGDAGVRANARQEKLFIGVILILIFAEALGLYGLIVALILSGNQLDCKTVSSKWCFQAA